MKLLSSAQFLSIWFLGTTNICNKSWLNQHTPLFLGVIHVARQLLDLLLYVGEMDIIVSYIDGCASAPARTETVEHKIKKSYLNNHLFIYIDLEQCELVRIEVDEMCVCLVID